VYGRRVGARQRRDPPVPSRIAVKLVQGEEVRLLLDPIGVLREATDDGLCEEGRAERNFTVDESKLGRRFRGHSTLNLPRGRLVLAGDERPRRWARQASALSEERRQERRLVLGADNSFRRHRG